jgi:hypothetical protein
MRTRGVIGSRIARPGWLDYSKVAFSLANGGASTSKPAVRAAAVEEEWKCQSTASAAGITRKLAGLAAAVIPEEDDEDDDGPVELTGAYKSLEIDIKRLKERLRYISKKWEIRIIAICEEHSSPTEMSKDDRAGESITAYIESIKGVQVFAQEAQELSQQDACDISETGEVEVISEVQAPTNIKSLEDWECISNQDSSAGTGVKCSAMYLVTHLTPIQELNKVVKKCKVTARELWSYSKTASHRIEVMGSLHKFELSSMREASGWMDKQYSDHWEIRLDRQLRATNKRYARLVFDPGGNLSSRQKKDGLYSIYYA